MTQRRKAMQTVIGLAVGLVVAAMLAVMPVAHSAPAEPIKFGFSAPLTSPIAFAAVRARNGTEFAAEALNARGGILGRRVEVLYGDTRLDPNEAINIARRFTLQDNVRAYFGDFTSSGTLAIIDILARANIPQITYTNAIKITRSGYKHVINLKPNSDHLTATALDYAVRVRGLKKLAIMALDDEYGKGNIDAIERYIKKYGGAQVIGSESYRIDAKEFRPLLTKLVGLKPDAIVLTGSLADTALIVKQYGELGLKIPLVGGGGHSSRAFRNIAGSASDGMIVAPAFWPDYFKNKQAAEFEVAFNARYGALAGDEWSTFAYDAVNMVAAAMQKANSTDGAQVVPELFKLGAISGASGTFRITPNGEIDTVVFVGFWTPDGTVKIIRGWKPPRLE
ncbi:MAG: branched-chain amino acid ABC transporter substrate-binding protein [Armatimonadota bacterium]